MLFNSFHFLLFFPIVTILFFVLPHKFRWLWLLGASCYFYMALIPIYILILILTIVVDYFAGIWIEQAEQKKKKTFLILSLITNIGILAFFKYYNFFIENINEFFYRIENPTDFSTLSIILPIGLSFHTFQAMSYTIEVYRGNQKAEKHFGLYALYVLFYPQLVAGPIERPQNILHQLKIKQVLKYENVSAGLKQMLWGLFKKVVIADRLSVIVDQVYNSPEEHNSFSLIIATWLFAFQIYCDFSGYSDIALGAARVMGFKLMENFNLPYFATSIRQFWEKWHISLSTWFRDYLYIPLGGNRVSKIKIYRNLFLVFMISGFWHGAKWNFLVWGALHGIFLIAGMLLFKKENKEKANSAFLRGLKMIFIFNLVCFAWIFFRADDLQQSWIVIKEIFNFNGSYELTFLGQVKANYFFTSVLLLFLFLWFDKFIQSLVKEPELLKSKWQRYFVFSFILSLFVLFGHFGNLNFIYFQF